MKTIKLLIMMLLLSLTTFAQYNQTVVDNYEDLTNLASVAERKALFMTFSNSMQAELWRYHIDEKIDDWTLSRSQENALYALKSEITASLAEEAESNAQTSSLFNDFNDAFSDVEAVFSSGQITELRILGNYSNPTRFGNFSFDEELVQDADSQIVYLQCPRERICFSVCHCAVNSVCSSCFQSFNCARTADGCGCFWFWSCNGRKNA